MGTATPAGDGTYTSSAAFTPGHSGDYWWYVSSPSDGNNNAAASGCPSAVETVVSVLVHNGAVLSDAAADAGSGVGSVSYYYCPSPGFTSLTCTSSTPWTPIGSSSNTSPYSVTWTGQPTNGDYVVVAVGTDNVLNADIAPSVSTPVTVSNIAPSVAVTYPVTGTPTAPTGAGRSRAPPPPMTVRGPPSPARPSRSRTRPTPSTGTGQPPRGSRAPSTTAPQRVAVELCVLVRQSHLWPQLLCHRPGDR